MPLYQNHVTALLLCSTGARSLKVFEQHANWSAVNRSILLPCAEDQTLIHRLIYNIKRNFIEASTIDQLVELASKYRVDSLVAGCTEFHIISKLFDVRQGVEWIDPLRTCAVMIRNMNSEMSPQESTRY